MENGKQNDRDLIDLFKVFSPPHLLKLDFANDSNSLNKPFYNELLYIIGLKETKEKGKKLIGRKIEGDRDAGSLLENAISRLIGLDKIPQLRNLANPEEFGETDEEKLFNVGLRLSINWINRVLFLKLLEAQLIKYHQGDRNFAFLNLDKVRDYQALDSLFFDVLAREQSGRDEDVREIFANVPYLNSSLFEQTEIEQNTITIGTLKGKSLPIFGASVLKDHDGKRRSGDLDALTYLFEFLDAYDFSSDELADGQEDSEKLINAAVLGLIFEKINGYKDGSFFTPSFITMYMCRETIRRAIVQKFNEVKGWDCENFDQLDDKISDKKEANAIINSLKICDPAVGSGHFLVSALNEIIAIKSELRVLLDREGKSLKDYRVEVRNDKLIVYDDEGKTFDYRPKNAEKQRVQEAIFHEKQTIIENCLFGVDINPNSVTICRLRLWIELLKNAYYKSNNQLETLPNIDINIKVGNSLISRFALDSDVSQVLKRQNFTIEQYRNAVQTYRSAESKAQKREMEGLIAKIKTSFKITLQGIDPKKTKVRRLEGGIENLQNQKWIIEPTKEEKKVQERKIAKLKIEIDKLTVEIKDIEGSKIYKNALEWRFEFPEVLNDAGDFIGFDVVIGNPPYITYHGRRRSVISNEMTTYFKDNYYCVQKGIKDGKLNSAMFFIEKATFLGNKNCISCLIVDISFYEHFYEGVKKILVCNTLIIEVVNGLSSFEDVGSGQIILSFKNILPDQRTTIDDHKVRFFENGLESNAHQISQIEWNNIDKRYQFYLPDDNFVSILEKFESNSRPLDFYFPNKLIRTGESIGVKEQGFVIDCITDEKIKTYNYLEGSKSIPCRYCKPIPTRWFRFDRDLMNQRNAAYRLEAEKNDRRNPKVLGIGDQLAFENPKILIRQSCNHLCCTYSDQPFVYNRSYYSISNKNSSGESSTNLFFILGLLNSRLFTYYARKKRIIRMEVGKQPQIRLDDLKKIPIKLIESDLQSGVSKKVQQILTTKESDPNTDTSALETEIDQLVYQLYGLTEAEIKIVEGANDGK